MSAAWTLEFRDHTKADQPNAAQRDGALALGGGLPIKVGMVREGGPHESRGPVEVGTPQKGTDETAH